MVRGRTAAGCLRGGRTMAASQDGGCAMTQVESDRPRDQVEVAVRKATEADVPQLTAALARAFDDDPLVNWMVAQDKRRARRVFDSMQLTLKKMTMPFGEVYTTGGVEGGAL